ncbi:hypothetical protein VPNG_05370 [Cytospora leucostoma]|uniref:Uncharacterized protein n=1 Tax=Cytospora leucostoma TaxID=1230097 RepID=A0A423X4X0_9PEZI|nr:hypothetical protein VPNG_05370 [Cytospora leucostoma]
MSSTQQRPQQKDHDDATAEILMVPFYDERQQGAEIYMVPLADDNSGRQQQQQPQQHEEDDDGEDRYQAPERSPDTDAPPTPPPHSKSPLDYEDWEDYLASLRRAEPTPPPRTTEVAAGKIPTPPEEYEREYEEEYYEEDEQEEEEYQRGVEYHRGDDYQRGEEEAELEPEEEEEEEAEAVEDIEPPTHHHHHHHHHSPTANTFPTTPSSTTTPTAPKEEILRGIEEWKEYLSQNRAADWRRARPASAVSSSTMSTSRSGKRSSLLSMASSISKPRSLRRCTRSRHLRAYYSEGALATTARNNNGRGEVHPAMRTGPWKDADLAQIEPLPQQHQHQPPSSSSSFMGGRPQLQARQPSSLPSLRTSWESSRGPPPFPPPDKPLPALPLEVIPVQVFPIDAPLPPAVVVEKAAPPPVRAPPVVEERPLAAVGEDLHAEIPQVERRSRKRNRSVLDESERKRFRQVYWQ